jgi:phage shock protein PspC (stress-responsive transcriptional regulator)
MMSMTETPSTAPQPAEAPTGAKPSGPISWGGLHRSADDRVVAGVCGGLGRHFDIDPLLFRVLFAVLAVFSAGTWLVAYTALWLIIPDEGAEKSIARSHYGDRIDRIGHQVRHGDTKTQVILAVLVVLLLALALGPLQPVLVLTSLVAVIVAALKQRKAQQGRPAAAPWWGWSRTPPSAPESQAPSTPDVSLSKQDPPADGTKTV